MAERWFEPEELTEMSRPTMDRAIEAIEAGDLEAAKRLCGEMKHEWEVNCEQGWKRHHAAIESLDRRKIVHLLAATWRAHSGSGVGEHPGSFTITEDDEGTGGYGRTKDAHDWSYGRKDFPLYCTHCSFMNESMPIQWSGYPVYPSDPPEDYSTDPCTWYWYKDREHIPERHWKRYGASKPA